MAGNVNPARKCYKVDVNSDGTEEGVSTTGSDIAGEFSAAFAFSYLLFKNSDPTFAIELLNNAIALN